MTDVEDDEIAIIRTMCQLFRRKVEDDRTANVGMMYRSL